MVCIRLEKLIPNTNVMLHTLWCFYVVLVINMMLHSLVVWFIKLHKKTLCFNNQQYRLLRLSKLVFCFEIHVTIEVLQKNFAQIYCVDEQNKLRFYFVYLIMQLLLIKGNLLESWAIDLPIYQGNMCFTCLFQNGFGSNGWWIWVESKTNYWIHS